MEIENEDIIFGSIAVVVLCIWLLTLLTFDSAVAIMIIIWPTMFLITIFYVYVYRKRKRDIRILRKRFFVSAIPVYPVIIIYVSKIFFEHEILEQYKFLPFLLISSALVLNGTVLYFLEIRK